MSIIVHPLFELILHGLSHPKIRLSSYLTIKTSNHSSNNPALQPTIQPSNNPGIHPSSNSPSGYLFTFEFVNLIRWENVINIDKKRGGEVNKFANMNGRKSGKYLCGRKGRQLTLLPSSTRRGRQSSTKIQ
jgi:hypothetical protein